jgi:hypothetical protein
MPYTEEAEILRDTQMTWDPKRCSLLIALSDNDKTATRPVGGGKRQIATVFGASTCNRFSIRIKDIGIAITDVKFQISFACLYSKSEANFYTVDIRAGYIFSGVLNHGKISIGTIIELIYNKQAHQISLKVNGKDCGDTCCYETKDLRPVLDLHSPYVSVELL